MSQTPPDPAPAEQEIPNAAPAAQPEAAPAGPEAFHKVLWAAWRDTSDREAPTLNQLVQAGVVRVDVDAVAGYLAVLSGGETHRAIGVRRELVAPLVAVLTGRTADEVAALLARGPAKIPHVAPPAPAATATATAKATTEAIPTQE